jgi:hypothetical protein
MLSVVMMALELVYIFKKDWAWQIVEAMLRTVKPQPGNANCAPPDPNCNVLKATNEVIWKRFS